jgi:hypothetical protein
MVIYRIADSENIKIYRNYVKIILNYTTLPDEQSEVFMLDWIASVV